MQKHICIALAPENRSRFKSAYACTSVYISTQLFFHAATVPEIAAKAKLSSPTAQQAIKIKVFERIMRTKWQYAVCVQITCH